MAFTIQQNNKQFIMYTEDRLLIKSNDNTLLGSITGIPVVQYLSMYHEGW